MKFIILKGLKYAYDKGLLLLPPLVPILLKWVFDKLVEIVERKQ